MHNRAFIVLAAAAALLAGCGGGSSGTGNDGDNSALNFEGEDRAAAQAVEDFATAIRNNDWDRLCNDVFSAKQRDLSTGLIADSCEEEVDRYDDLDNLRLTALEVQTENSARVDVTTTRGSGATFDLIQEGGAWRIDGMSGDFTAGGDATGETAPGSGHEAAVAQVVLDYDQALADRDYGRACSLLSMTERDSAFDGCEAEAREDYGGRALGLSIDEVSVKLQKRVRTRTGKGDHAGFAVVPESGRWKIDSYAGTFGD